MVKEAELKPYTSAVTREIVHGPVLPQERCFLPTTTCKMQQPDKQILVSLHFTFIKICNHLQYKALNDLAPSFTTELLNPYCTFRSLRSTGQGLLNIPYSSHKTKEGCAFELLLCGTISLRAVGSVSSILEHIRPTCVNDRLLYF